MEVKYFPNFEWRASMEKQQAIIYQKVVNKIKKYQRISTHLLDKYSGIIMKKQWNLSFL